MCVCLYVFEPLMFFGTNYNSKPRLLKSHIMEGNQSFATMKLLGGILIFKMFSKKGDSEKKKKSLAPPSHLLCSRDSYRETCFRKAALA